MNKIFNHFCKIFNENGYRLYMIGSASRDFLLKNTIEDYDFVTDAKPEDINKFLSVNKTFQKFGVSQLKYDDIHVDIVTFRKEKEYSDSRHPNLVTFASSIQEDFSRRDFTINCIYIDENYNVIDPTNFGVSDLKNKIIRFIGDPLTRIKEDPLRIIRAYRFKNKYGFSIEENTKKYLIENVNLIKNLNPNKIKEEIRKMGLGEMSIDEFSEFLKF